MRVSNRCIVCLLQDSNYRPCTAETVVESKTWTQAHMARIRNTRGVGHCKNRELMATSHATPTRNEVETRLELFE